MALDKKAMRNLRPSEILFTQDSINNYFRRDSDHPNKQIGETLDDLLNGIIQISDIPEVRVFKSKRRWYTRDNRRLWVFRKMETFGKCTDIPVQITDETSDRRATKKGASTIRVRGDEGGTDWWKLSSPSTGTPSTPGTGFNLRTKRAGPEFLSSGNISKAKKENRMKNKQSEHGNCKLGFILDALLIGECDIWEIPTITVVKMDGLWYTLNNRRLWVFQKLEELGHCQKIPVIKGDYIPPEKLSTECDGTSIYVRGDPGGHLWKRMEDQLSDEESSDDYISDDEESDSENSDTSSDDEYEDSSYDESDDE